MRRGGDGAVEDTARAIRRLIGTTLLDGDAWTELDVVSDEDQDRQLDDYHDCLGVLLYALGMQEVAPILGAVEGEA
jgi:hypothetical protein